MLRIMITAAQAQAELARYEARAIALPAPTANVMNSVRVEILRDGQLIGSYERNYPALFETFVPFMQSDGSTYALYSRDYTASRIMRLPECEDLGGEESNSVGFCPTGFYVPFDPERGMDGTFGFVAGCIWGDDSSDKVQFLDLSAAAKGRLVRSNRFGYLELPVETGLAEAINLSDFDRSYRGITIRNDKHFEIELRSGERDPALDDEDELSPALDITRKSRTTAGTGPLQYRAQYFDDRSNWIHSRSADDFFAVFERAQRWARLKNREVRVMGVEPEGSWWIICYVQPDGSYHFRAAKGEQRKAGPLRGEETDKS